MVHTVPSTAVAIDFINECTFTATILRIESIQNVSLLWSGVYDEQVSDIKGALCCPIECSVKYNDDKVITEFSTVDLMATKEYLENVIINNTNFTFPKFKLIYFSNEFKNLISVKNNENEEINSVEKLKCKICFHMISLERLRVHVGKHILKNETAKSPNLCGYCGIVGCSID